MSDCGILVPTSYLVKPPNGSQWLPIARTLMGVTALRRKSTCNTGVFWWLPDARPPNLFEEGVEQVEDHACEIGIILYLLILYHFQFFLFRFPLRSVWSLVGHVKNPGVFQMIACAEPLRCHVTLTEGKLKQVAKSFNFHLTLVGPQSAL
eukprot:g56408.t1